jgi:cytoskeletal protein CcmA (bactofilin family)
MRVNFRALAAGLPATAIRAAAALQPLLAPAESLPTMREERGQLAGNQTIAEELELTGSIAGDVAIVEGGKVYVRGAIYGSITVEDGGRVHVYGHVQGNLTVLDGAKAIVSGVIGGNAINRGGRLYIDEMGKVMGKLRRIDGETQVHRKAQVQD